MHVTLVVAWLLAAPIFMAHAQSSCVSDANIATILATACGRAPSSTSPSCSIRNLCQPNAVSTPLAPSVCLPMALFVTLCKDMPTIPECVQYKARFTSDATYNQCVNTTALPLPSTATTTSSLNADCSTHYMASCDTCTATNCPNPLSTMVDMCNDMDMPSCRTVLRPFCTAIGPANVAVWCLDANQRPASCVADPTQAACMSYTYAVASVDKDLGGMCTAMPDMPACSVMRKCKAGTVDARFCNNFTLLASGCVDMPGMTACSTYRMMCIAGSKVPQCSTYAPIPRLPGTFPARNAVLDACSTHTMPGCETCTSGTMMGCPDPLDSLSAICLGMPTMSECKPHGDFCSAVKSGMDEYCAADANGREYLPTMLMYFHERFEELVLWKEWRPRTQGDYVGTIFAVLGMGVASMALKTVKSLLVLSWAVSSTGHPTTSAVKGGYWWMPCGQQVLRSGIKAIVSGVAITLDYFNMLIAMTFNVGLFVAVVCGYILGTFLFCHLPDNYQRHLAVNAASASGRSKPDACSSPNGSGSSDGQSGVFVATRECDDDNACCVHDV